MINLCFCFYDGESLCILILWLSFVMLTLNFALFLVFPFTMQLTKGSSPLFLPFYLSQKLCVSKTAHSNDTLSSFFPIVYALFYLHIFKKIYGELGLSGSALHNFRPFSYLPSVFPSDSLSWPCSPQRLVGGQVEKWRKMRHNTL